VGIPCSADRPGHLDGRLCARSARRAIVYNLGHSLVTGVAIGGVGVATGNTPLIAIGAIFIAHSGMDRMMGYGLKLPSSFKDTHLGRIGRHG
jgi:hypothetical protein